MKKTLLSLFIVFVQFQFVAAQQKNYITVNVGDCINCTAALSNILQKDPKATFVIHEEYLMDSIDVIEKFNLQSYRIQIIWSSHLYDSLSSQTESELIQFYDSKEVNRSSLRSLQFAAVKTLPTNKLCLDNLSNHIQFRDYENFMTITNNISKKQYVYYKKKNELREIGIDSNLARSVYIDFLKNPELYKLYAKESKSSSALSPKILSVFPYDDSTLLGALQTYDAKVSNIMDTVFSPMLSIIKINSSSNNQVLFLQNVLPKSYQYISIPLLAYQRVVYTPLHLDVNQLLENKSSLENLARLKREKNVYKFDKYMPSVLNDYLIVNKINQNGNTHFLDNGYYFMSLSNFILNVETEKKVYLPFDDSLFNKIELYPGFKGMNYNVWDFKFNIKEQKFYIYYVLENSSYLASFKLGADTFDSNEKLYSFDSPFLKDIKNTCLSWDGKYIIYAMKNDNCFGNATVVEIQELAKNYKRKAE